MHHEDVAVDQSKTVIVKQHGELAEDDEARVANKDQLVNDMLQDQLEELPIEQWEGFADDGKARAVDDESLVDNMPLDFKEEDAQIVPYSSQLLVMSHLFIEKEMVQYDLMTLPFTYRVSV